MTDPTASQSSHRLTWGSLAAWAVAFFGAFVAFFVTPADDFGLAAGWNKVGVFMVWQAAAAVLAILVAVFSRSVPKGQLLRRLGLVPVGLLVLGVLAIVALILWANFSRPPPTTETGAGPAVTAPAVEPLNETGPALGNE